MTFGELKQQVQRWMREAIDDDIVSDACNDAVESLWSSIILFQLSQFFGGPVSSLSFGIASERGQLISVVNPPVKPTVTQVTAGALPQGTLYTCFTLVTESGSETLPSPYETTLKLINKVISINPAYVAGAYGYNVYCGDDPARMGLQNAVPLPFGTLWQEDETGIIDVAQSQPVPQVNNTADNLFYIRHMEVQLPDGTYKAWNQADIDSSLMRKAASSLAANSPYQDYIYDFVNSTTQGISVEVRPAAGAALAPRFFFVAKPRRVRFDNVQLPFPTLPATMFLRSFAISMLKLSNEEYEAHQQWDATTEQERTRVLKAINQMNAPKDNRIVPYMT